MVLGPTNGWDDDQCVGDRGLQQMEAFRITEWDRFQIGPPSDIPLVLMYFQYDQHLEGFHPTARRYPFASAAVRKEARLYRCVYGHNGESNEP